MNKYEITKIRQETFTVEAKSEEDAIELVEHGSMNMQSDRKSTSYNTRRIL